MSKPVLPIAGRISRQTILKVGHHGSAASTSSAFLSKAHSKIIVIEVGAGNSYGHQTSAKLLNLASRGRGHGPG
ncbi:MAG: hypothetical protein WCK53_10445 [Methanomicrobiales archaeon]